MPLPFALLSQATRHLTRDELADLCEQLIDRMDAMDPDPDLEAEDDYCTAGDDRGTADRWGIGRDALHDDDREASNQPASLN